MERLRFSDDKSIIIYTSYYFLSLIKIAQRFEITVASRGCIKISDVQADAFEKSYTFGIRDDRIL